MTSPFVYTLQGTSSRDKSQGLVPLRVPNFRLLKLLFNDIITESDTSVDRYMPFDI